MVEEAVDASEEIFISALPIKNIVLIFIVTFLLVFILFTMVEPYFHCHEMIDGTQCRLLDITGEFIFGIAIAGVLFLFDMILLYMTLSDYFM
ncbi:MAG: hypothetical protein JSV63_03825 [Candidatus Aenigmatarchaeota archaeon]|nr:MAG: hypothetical protein JSV63_03825 [Candidatus Aenigmarchaeota archaeon]